jgi:hypothetical protein
MLIQVFNLKYRFYPDEISGFFKPFKIRVCSMIEFPPLALDNTIDEPKEFVYEFFTVKTSKLILLSLSTFFLYLFYWFYQNWYFYKVTSGERFRILKRAGEFPLTAYCLFRHANRQSDKSGISDKVNIAKCWGLIVFGLAMISLPFPFSLLYFVLPIIGIVSAQKVMIKINEANGFKPITSDKFSFLSFFMILLFFPLFILFLIGIALGL